jgi:hypothetical protein
LLNPISNHRVNPKRRSVVDNRDIPEKLEMLSLPQIVLETITWIIALNARGNWLSLERPEADAVKIYQRI